MSQEDFAKGQSIGRRLISGRGFVTTGIGVGAGAAVAAGAQMLAEHTDFFAKYWYAPALAVAFVGHIAKAARNGMIAVGGAAMTGAAGAMAYYSYKLNAASAKASNTAGVQDTGAVSSSDYVEALRALPDTSGVQSMPNVRRTNPVSQMTVAAAA